jgi:hypothetical protein
MGFFNFQSLMTNTSYGASDDSGKLQKAYPQW